MASAAKGSDSKQQSDETFELICSPCKRKDRNTEAEKYCADCNDYYCSDCVKFHQDIPFLSGHKILDKGQERTARTLPVAPTERCERHRFKPVDMYCRSHDDVGCYTCMAVDHRSCKDIFDIPEYVENNKETTSTKLIREELQKAEGSLKDNIETCKREKERLLKSKEDAMHSLHDFREVINKILDEMEQNSIASIEKKYKGILEKIDGELRDLESCRSEVKSADNSLISSGSNASQLFVSSRKGNRAVIGATRCSEEIRTGIKEINVYFRKKHKVLASLEVINDIGSVTRSTDLYMYVSGRKKQYNIRHQSDNTACNISSACVFEDGSIVLADRGNKILKRIDRKYTHVDVCDLQVEPYQMCQADKEALAVIAYAGRAIVFISVGSEMKKTREITVDYDCYGIAAANGNIYVADSRTSVFVYNIYGTKLSQFTKDQSGQDLFRSLYGMAVSDDGMKIYVTDDTYGLVVLNKDGTLHGKYSCKELGNVKRVCAAENGSILVSGDSDNCILQFTSDGEKLGNVMASDNENESCGAICFDQQNYKLLVGRPGKNEIDIYDLA